MLEGSGWGSDGPLAPNVGDFSILFFGILEDLGEGFGSSCMYLGRFWVSLDASWTMRDHFYYSWNFLCFEDSFEAQRLDAGQPLTGTFFKICFNFWNPFSFFDFTKACACC